MLRFAKQRDPNSLTEFRGPEPELAGGGVCAYVGNGRSSALAGEGGAWLGGIYLGVPLALAPIRPIGLMAPLTRISGDCVACETSIVIAAKTPATCHQPLYCTCSCAQVHSSGQRGHFHNTEPNTFFHISTSCALWSLMTGVTSLEVGGGDQLENRFVSFVAARALDVQWKSRLRRVSELSLFPFSPRCWLSLFP